MQRDFPVILVPTVALVLILCVFHSRWLWRLSRQVWGFRTAVDGRIVVHYAPDLDLDVPVFLRRCHAELDRLNGYFGIRLRGRVAVYLFATWKDIAGVFGPHYGGAALSNSKAILIAKDTNIQDLMRHEFAHLFSARWNKHVPPLLAEGLSVWLQETNNGLPIDMAARPFLTDSKAELSKLLKSDYFFSEPQRFSCYLLAGSFTGFLIRRYGLQKYRRLFHSCNGKAFRAKFKKCLGVTLQQAEAQWRVELASFSAGPGSGRPLPAWAIGLMEIFNRRLGRHWQGLRLSSDEERTLL